jgi:DNA invertase Pin-like site-specific DNA recombinase
MKAIIYTRVSTDEQSKSGLGLEAQKRMCMEAATKLRIADVQIFSDEGVSGSVSIADRPALSQSLASLRKGDYFIVAKRDRIARDMFIALSVEQLLTSRKAVFVSAAGEGSGTDTNDVSGLIQRRMFDLFAEVERQMIRSRTKAALQSKKIKGERIGQIPYGYSLSNDGIHLVLCEREQKVIALVKELKSQGVSSRETVNYLNKNKILSRTGNIWGRTQIVRMLSHM